jgi:hypothetical protein
LIFFYKTTHFGKKLLADGGIESVLDCYPHHRASQPYGFPPSVAAMHSRMMVIFPNPAGADTRVTPFPAR